VKVIGREHHEPTASDPRIGRVSRAKRAQVKKAVVPLRRQCHPAVPRGLRDLKRYGNSQVPAPTPRNPRRVVATSVKSTERKPEAQLVVAKHPTSKGRNNRGVNHLRHRAAPISGSTAWFDFRP